MNQVLYQLALYELTSPSPVPLSTKSLRVLTSESCRTIRNELKMLRNCHLVKTERRGLSCVHSLLVRAQDTQEYKVALDQVSALAEKRLGIKLSQQRENAAYGALTDVVISEQYQTISSLKQQVSTLEAALQDARACTHGASAETLLCFGKEKNLYPGEQQALIMNILTDALKICEDGSRRHHVITSVLEANPCKDVVSEKRQALKKYLKGFSRMDSGSRRKLQSLGFIIDSSSSHHHLCFYGDPRYCAVLPKTGSDSRGGLNTATDMCRRML